jgi:signal transduction histidine kinase
MIEQWLRQYCLEGSQLLLFCHEDFSDPHFSNALKDITGDETAFFIELLTPLSLQNEAQKKRLAEAFNLRLIETKQLDGRVVYQFNHVNDVDADWVLFVDALTRLHEISHRLSRLQNMDDILRFAISEAQEHLGIDRLGMLLFDQDKNEMIGTWGTNEEGDLNDEHDFRQPMPDSPWVLEALKSKNHVALWENVPLKQYGKEVGIGWNAMAAMWDGEKAIGWIACDNLITRKPMQPWLKEIIGQFGQILGNLIVRLQQQQALESINQNLELLVDERSKQLNLKVEQLESAQEELIESEKLASLGGLVAGVAHEVNTPLGISVTAASHLNEQTNTLVKSYAEKIMTKSQLEKYFNQAEESSQIILNNLQRASELVSSFKQLAVEQSNDIKDDIQLHLVVDNICKSLHHSMKNRPIIIHNHVSEALMFKSFTGKVNQIFTNLINNSLLHAFEFEDSGDIYITANIEGDMVKIEFKDNGVGVEKDKLASIFDPFYTTKRGKGGTGLGLNIIFNLINKLDGKLSVQANEPKGLCFTIFIPVQ